ncbi:MAG: signal peptidase I [Candidatus Pacebacteria bacterium]|nr:signal peptidase I [Candidatus Paceibacterota bacterium]
MEEHVTKKSWKHEVIEVLKYVSLALIIVIPVRLFVAQPFIVSGESMYPTFHNSDYLIVDEMTYHLRAPERGEVIVFRYPNDPSRFFIKRIIGLPGETIVLKGATLTIKNTEHPDGFVLKEPYVASRPPLGNKTITLPADQYFVMGDNRPASSDSRIWGPLPADLIVGRAFLRLLPVRDISAFPGSIQSFDLDTYEVTE